MNGYNLVFLLIFQNSRTSRMTKMDACKKKKNTHQRFTLQQRFILERSVARTKLTESFKGARKPTIPASRLTKAFPVFYLRLIPPALLVPQSSLASFLARRQNTVVSRDGAKKTLTKHPLVLRAPSNKRAMTPLPPRAASLHPPSYNGVGRAAYDVTRAQRYTYMEIEPEGKAAALERRSKSIFYTTTTITITAAAPPPPSPSSFSSRPHHHRHHHQ